MEPLAAYLHHLAIILTASFLVAEMVVCRPGLGAEQVRVLPRLDVLFFVAALAALATGLLRLFAYGKGLGFYLPNPVFYAKMALYLAIAVLSIKPTFAFMRWHRALAGGGGPPPVAEVASVRRLIHVEVGLLALMPLLAVLMARGIGR
jgi:putative membrane protein